MKAQDLSAAYFGKVNEIFETNNWEIEATENSHFKRYCTRLSDLRENKKKDLVLELTARYLWIQDKDYLNYLIESLKILSLEKLKDNNVTKFYIAQLITPKDKVKDIVKSSARVVYLFNETCLRFNAELSKYKFELITNRAEITNDYLEANRAMLILADDYIGTGETARECVDDILTKNDISKEKIIVLSLVAQETGINNLTEAGILAVAASIQKKGISDYYDHEVVGKKLELMNDIEKKLSVKEKYHLGYGQSEALVTMSRTPNNTFPVFWEENGNMKLAPFPRF